MKNQRVRTAILVTAMGCVVPAISQAEEIRLMCYQDDPSVCGSLETISQKFEDLHPDVNVAVDVVPYKAILESLPIQLAGGTGPDIAMVTDFGGLQQYYLDLAPYVDRQYWESNMGKTLDWFRGGPNDNGIYGLLMQMTVTGAYINQTLFEQAGVAVPGPEATWEEWGEASRQVAKATGVAFPMGMDRSGHRIAGPAISYGAKIFDESGQPILVDKGFTDYMKLFDKWNRDGTMARHIWVSQGGTAYGDGAQEFISGDLVYLYSGSWQVGRFDTQIGDFFDWKVVGSPCGVGGCSGMPGGSGLVGFKQTQHPKTVAALLDFIAQENNYAYFTAQTRSIPANKSVASKGVEYVGASKAAASALNAWSQQVGKISPVAFDYQGYSNNRAMFNITVQRVTQALVGEMSVDEAMAKAKEDLANVLAETK